MISSRFLSRLIARLHKPLKLVAVRGPDPKSKAPSQGLIQACRFASSSRPLNLRDLSDVEEYVERDFTLSDLENKRKAETLPSLVTTSSLIDKCGTRDDLLRELELATIGGKLWKDELMLYLTKFLELRKLEIYEMRKASHEYSIEEKISRSDVVLTDPKTLLDNPYFQHLLLQILTHAPFFTTVNLTNAFYCFACLSIPPTSNTMSFLVVILQNRINDFFPLDVLRCHDTIRFLEGHGSLAISNLECGLLQHLENQTVDEIGFLKILSGTPLSARFRLFRSLKGSKELRRTIINSCVETIKQRPHQDLWNIHELRDLLRACIVGRWYNRDLLTTASRFVRSNSGLVTQKELTLIEVAKERLNIQDRRLLRRLSLPQTKQPVESCVTGSTDSLRTSEAPDQGPRSSSP